MDQARSGSEVPIKSIVCAVLATAAAVIGYCVLPTSMAALFSAAIHNGDGAVADAMTPCGDDRCTRFASPRQLSMSSVKVQPLTMDDLLCGRRRLSVAIPWGKTPGEYSCDLVYVSTIVGLNLKLALF